MVFLYSLSGTCFICNEKFDFVSSKEDIEGRKIPFKMLLRYLGVNNLLEHHSSGVSLCGGCSSRLNGFWQLYQEFENLRLCLDDYVQGFLERMKATRQNPHENSSREQSEETTELREAVIKRCTFKIHGTPLIKLKRTNVSQLQPTATAVINSPSPTITSQDIKIEVNDSIDDSYEDYYSSVANDQDELSPSPSPSPTRKRIKIHILKSKKPLKNEKISSATTYTCQTCKKSFQNFKTYVFHKRSHKTIKKVEKTKRKLKCEICKLVISHKRNLDLHNVAHHLMEFYSSKIPPGTKKAELQEATRILISKKKIYSSKEAGCPFCSRLVQKYKLGYHLQLEHFDKVLLAVKNPKDDSLQEVHLEHKKFRRHPKSTLHNDGIANIKYNLIPGAKPLQCCICEKSYSTLRRLKLHALLKHTVAHLDDKFSPGITQNDVDTCINSFLSESETHLGGKWSCPLCSLGMTLKYKLHVHLMSLHLDKIIHRIGHPSKSPRATNKKTLPEKNPRKNVYTCPTCQRVFRKYKLFLVHKTNHKTGCTRKPVKCTLCDIVFSEKQAFQRHSIKIHTFPYLRDKLPPDTTQDGLLASVNSFVGEGQPINVGGKWRCSVCSKEFIERSYLRTHLLMSHLDKIIHRLKEPVALASGSSSGTKSYKLSLKCWACGDCYGCWNTLGIHRKLEHPGLLECRYCKRSFQNINGLNAHVMNHHTFIFFKDKLSPETMEEELEKVIDEVVSEGAVEKNKGRRCPLCSVDFGPQSGLRKHVLHKHFSEVVSLLDSKQNCTI